MRLKSWILIAISLAVILSGLSLFQNYRVQLPGIINRLKDPILENQAVNWRESARSSDGLQDDVPPNIVVILVDDLGINDISTFGGGVADGFLQTPNIDALAENGAVFTNGYAGNATCAPSRAAIMTGRYATRFGFEFTPAPVAFHRLLGGFEYGSREAIYNAELETETIPLSEQGLPSSEITMAELLREEGYRTLFLGKWHLGESEEFQPQSQGFDEWLGFLPGAALFLPVDDPDVVNSIHDFDPVDQYLWPNLSFAVRHNGSQRFQPDRYMTDYLADNAVSAIQANAHNPFFLYLSLNAPHTPLQALRSDFEALSGIENERLRVYAAMILAVDRAVGQVSQALEEAGVADNTLIIFSSDNGGAGYVGFADINAPFRGWKASFFEGGIRVPMFMQWPDRIPAGTQIEHPAAHVDIFTTAAHAAGATLPQDRVLDGQNLMTLIENPDAPSSERSLYWRSGHYRAYLQDGWKLQISDHPSAVWLFNLNEDPTEQVNLAEDEPERLAAMLNAYEALNADQIDPIWPSLVAPPIYIDRHILEEKREDDVYVHWPN